MSRGRKKKKKGVGTIVMLLLVIVVCVIVLIGLVSGSFKDGIQSAVTGKVTEQFMEQAIRKALESSGDPEAAAKAKEIFDSIDEEDKKAAEEIIGKYAKQDTVSDLIDIAGGGINSESVEQIKDYLQDNMSEDDIQKLQELYNKYGEQVP